MITVRVENLPRLLYESPDTKVVVAVSVDHGRVRVYVCDGRLVVGNDDHGLGMVYVGGAPAHPTARQIRDEIRFLLPLLMDHPD